MVFEAKSKSTVHLQIGLAIPMCLKATKQQTKVTTSQQTELARPIHCVPDLIMECVAVVESIQALIDLFPL